MKKRIVSALLAAVVLTLSGCSQGREPVVWDTFEQTPVEQAERCVENGEEVTLRTYYEMSDGTWKTDDYAYQYKLVVAGRLHNAVDDITYTILSNIEEISFEQAWKASGLSSNLDDYFQPEDAVFVAIQ